LFYWIIGSIFPFSDGENMSMENFRIRTQPDDTTCGPTCLHSVMAFHGADKSLDEIIEGVASLEQGGTLAVMLGCYALENGFKATIFPYSPQIFDPSWHCLGRDEMLEKLKKQMEFKVNDEKLRVSSESYIEFLENGGKLKFEDLTPSLVRRYLNKKLPIITGLSATYLYGSVREYGESCEFDDIRGEPTGHFVVLHGYDIKTRLVSVADPFRSEYGSGEKNYDVGLSHLVCSILLGVLTYDAKLLIIEPSEKRVK